MGCILVLILFNFFDLLLVIVFSIILLIQMLALIDIKGQGPICIFQMTIQASDGRGETAIAVATIIILRNPDDQNPQFINLDVDGIYRESILFNHAVNSTVSTRPLVVDPDQMVNRFITFCFIVVLFHF